MSVDYCSPLTVKFLAQVEYNQFNFDSDPDYEAFIDETLIPAAIGFIDNYVGHNFQSNSGTVRLDGSGKEALHINRIGMVDTGSGYETPKLLPVPMMTITAISFNGVAKTVTDFQIYDEIIRYENNIFDAGRQNIVIEGTWGYASVPDDIRFVAAQLCANTLTGMIRSRMLPDIITPILTGGGDVGALFSSPKVLTKSEKEILSRYIFREYAVG